MVLLRLVRPILKNPSLCKGFQRSVVTVQRRCDPEISRRYNARWPHMTYENYVYDALRDYEAEPEQPLKVVLVETVDGIGVKGEVVSVDRDYARKELLLPRLAVYATEENIEKYSVSAEDLARLDRTALSSKYVSYTMAFVKSRVFFMFLSPHNSWTVSPWHVRLALRQGGLSLSPDTAIQMPEEEISGPQKDGGMWGKEFFVTVPVNKREQLRPRFRLLPWENDPLLRAKLEINRDPEEAGPALLKSQVEELAVLQKEFEDSSTPEKPSRGRFK